MFYINTHSLISAFVAGSGASEQPKPLREFQTRQRTLVREQQWDVEKHRWGSLLYNTLTSTLFTAPADSPVVWKICCCLLCLKWLSDQIRWLTYFWSSQTHRVGMPRTTPGCGITANLYCFSPSVLWYPSVLYSSTIFFCSPLISSLHLKNNAITMLTAA